MEITIVAEQMFVMLFLITAGFTMRKLGLFGEEIKKLLQPLLLNAAIPAMILVRGTSAAGGHTNLYMAYVFALSILAFVSIFLVSILISRLIRAPLEDRGALASIGMFPSVAFMGFPIALALFGSEGMFYAVIFNFVCTVGAFSVGIKLLSGQAKFSFKQLCTPVIGASVAALTLGAFDVGIPPLLVTPLTHLGNMLTPLAMILLGSILSEMNLREMLLGWRIYVFIGVKLILTPVTIFLVLSQFTSNALLTAVIVVLAACPTAGRTTILCLRYGGNYKLVSQGVCLTTIFGIVTIPLLLYLLPI